MCYMGLESNGCFMVGAALTGSHYRTDIISGVGHPRSNLVVLLMLCTVAYNIWGTSVVLHVPRVAPTMLGMGNISGKPYMIVMT